MEASPVTRASLLVRIRDPRDQEAWQQFVHLYASLVYGFVRQRGLQDADAADLMQEVLRSVASAAGRLNYDPERGSFRSFLYTVTRNKLYNFLNGQRRQIRGSGASDIQERLEQQTAPQEESAQWDQEYERRVFTWAAEQVRGEFQEQTWQAFWLTAVEGQNAREVGQQLKMSPGAVYVAKSRVLARLRQQIQTIESGTPIPD